MKIIIISEGETDFPKTIASLEESALARLSKDNLNRVELLCSGLSECGCEVLLIRAKPTEKPSGSFELTDSGRFKTLYIETGKSKPGVRLPIKEYFDFSAVLSEKAKKLLRLFTPDVIIYSALFPFCNSAAEKLAELSGAVLITELPCSTAKLTQKVKFPFFDTLLAPVLKKGMTSALQKSRMLVSYYPAAKSEFPEHDRFWERHFPFSLPQTEPSEAAKALYDELSAFKGNGFLLIYGGAISEGLRLEELAAAFAAFGEKYRLALIGDGSYNAVLKRFCREHNAENVFFFGGIPKEELSFVFGAGDAVFVSENKLSEGAFPVPEEVFYALASGKPVFAPTKDFSGIKPIERLAELSEISRKLDSLTHKSTEEASSAEKTRTQFAADNTTEKYIKAYYDKISNLT